MENPYSSSLNFTRLAFLLISTYIGVILAAGTRGAKYEISMWTGVLGVLMISIAIVYLEHLGRRFTLKGSVTVIFGLMVGVFCAWLMNLFPIQELIESLAASREQAGSLLLLYRSMTYLSLAYIGVSLALRSGHEDFALIIPYIRFRQSNASEQLLLLGPSAIMDGRLLPLIKTGALEGRIIVPNYVLEEIKQFVASSSSGKRERGERALNSLEHLRKNKEFRMSVNHNDEMDSDDEMDMRLVKTARTNNAKLITTDDALTKTARLQNVPVMNLDEVSKAFLPPINVGDHLKLTITRPGKEEHQGVGYLPDGSMIVVNHGAQYMGSMKPIVVISKLQTNTGLMVFAEIEEN